MALSLSLQQLTAKVALLCHCIGLQQLTHTHKKKKKEVVGKETNAKKKKKTTTTTEHAQLHRTYTSIINDWKITAAEREQGGHKKGCCCCCCCGAQLWLHNGAWNGSTTIRQLPHTATPSAFVFGILFLTFASTYSTVVSTGCFLQGPAATRETQWKRVKFTFSLSTRRRGERCQSSKEQEIVSARWRRRFESVVDTVLD